MDENKTPTNFIRKRIDEDVASGKVNTVVTRFPPEPNGYLHIGHAKSIYLNYGIAKDYHGRFHLRFDDTNPEKEEQEYIDNIIKDLQWLGADWGGHLYYASDYFDQLYTWAVELIEKGKAYVCDLTPDAIRENRGTLTEPGRHSPYRDRRVEENLDLFHRMKAGEFPDGTRCLRAKIDMASGNLNLRDPLIYRIRHAVHPRTGNTWCIYPLYDFTHGLSDAIEGITHSICTLEFEDHRPLYDWFIENVSAPCHPQQIEFAKLHLNYTVTSKRRLLRLVEEKAVDGWDDPRMPTLSGYRRRGFTPGAIKEFTDRIGVAKTESMVDIALLEHCQREELNATAMRVMAVLRPLKVVLTNYPEGQVEWMDAENNPEDPGAGTRRIPFTKELYIEQDDFMEDPPKKYFRLSPGSEIRLKHAYYITCDEAVKDPDTGEITELRCSCDPDSRGGWTEDGRKIKGTSHWVSAAHALDAEVRIYNRLFLKENPYDVDDEEQDYMANLNPDSINVLSNCKVEPSLKETDGTPLQFLRQGYFCADSKDSRPDALVFNQIVSLKDSWSRMQGK